MSNQPQEHHNQYWNREHEIEFSAYERNLVLPPLFKEGEVVLDVGCGDGAVAHFLKTQKLCQVYGVDFSHTALKRASRRGLPVVCGDLSTVLPIKSSSVDTVFFGDVIEHLYFPEVALKEIRRVIKPNGRLILSCPNMGYWRYRLQYLTTGLFPETEWIEPHLWNSEHIRFFNPKLLYDLLSFTGFTPKRFIGVSRRRLDLPLLNLLPKYFGMIMVVESHPTLPSPQGEG
jgi:methionine biosynthesis protein MetW